MDSKLFFVSASGEIRENTSVLTYATTAKTGFNFYATRSGADDNPTASGSFYFIIVKLESANIGVMTVPFNNNNIYINRRVNGTWTGWKSVALS